jgi:hypothetical protein
LSRNSHGVVQRASGGIVITASRETNSDLVLSVTSQATPTYSVGFFLESTTISTVGCSAGQNKALATLGLAYSSLSLSHLIQGPLSASDITIESNPCYNFSLAQFTTPVCIKNGTCVGSIQVETQCRSDSNSFLFCNNGAWTFNSTLINVLVQARECAGRPSTCTGHSPVVVTNGVDSVVSSVDFASALHYLDGVSVYQSGNTSLPLTSPLPIPTTAPFAVASNPGIVALFFQGPQTAEYIDLNINTTCLRATIYSSGGTALASALTYAHLIANSFVGPVKASGHQLQTLKACTSLEGCDSLAINKSSISLAYPTATYVTFSKLQPTSASPSQTQTITVAIVENNFPDIHPHIVNVIKNTFIVFGVVAGALVVTGIAVGVSSAFTVGPAIAL